MLAKLNKKQVAALDTTAQQWIEWGLHSEFDFDASKFWISKAYETASLPPPTEWEYLDDPLQGQRRANQLVANAISCYGTQEAGWVAFYAFFLQECGITACEKLIPFMELVKAGCGWWWPFQSLCIITPTPKVQIKDRQLHCETGPAILYPSGWSIYALHGRVVPDWLILTPSELLDPLKVLQEENVEVRREGIRKIGLERLVYKLKGTSLDKKGNYELLSVPIGNSRTCPALKMLNPSVPECWHVEWVAPTCSTVEQALAWRNGTNVAPTLLT